MKRVFLGFVFALVLVSGARGQELTATVADVILLAQSGISEATILTFLQTRTVDLTLSAEEIARLQKAGVSEAVIWYMLQRPGPADPSLRSYVVPVVNGTGYPSYYYRSGYVGVISYPQLWYYDNYQGLGHSYVPHFYGSSFGVRHPGIHHSGVRRHQAYHGNRGHSSVFSFGRHRSYTGIGHSTFRGHRARSHRGGGIHFGGVSHGRRHSTGHSGGHGFRGGRHGGGHH